MLLTLDPSLTSAGVAAFRGDTLIACDSIKRKRDPNLIRRIRNMASEVNHWFGSFLGLEPEVTLVMEWPQVYPRERSKANPNTAVVPLAGVCAAVAAQWTCEVRIVFPAEWKGQLTKTQTKAIIDGRLDVDESAVVDGHGNDAYDAVGIGLYHLGRLRPKFARG